MGKGGDFEREVAKSLTVWLTGQEKPYAYWRMPGSGSLSTIHEANKNLTGDIVALNQEAEFLTDAFNIECKTGYPQTSFWQHFKHIKNFNIEIFWQQSIDDANKAGKYPMLIYRKLRQQPIVGVSEYISEKLHLYNLRHMKIDFGVYNGNRLQPICFFNSQEFWSFVRPDAIKNLIK
jgi:hypothetical protein